MNTLKSTFKKFIYGTIPYCFCKLFHADSPNLKYYQYIKSNGYARHLFEFKEEYEQMRFPVQEDKEKNALRPKQARTPFILQKEYPSGKD